MVDCLFDVFENEKKATHLLIDEETSFVERKEKNKEIERKKNVINNNL